MTETALDEVGPVDYVVVEFPAGASNAVVAAAVTPGPAPVAKTAVVAAAVTPGRGRRRRI